MLTHLTNLSLILVVFAFNLIEGTLSPKSPKSKKTTEEKFISGPQSYSVFDKNLVVENPTYKEIITNNKAYFENTNSYNFDGLLLGYVTPVSIKSGYFLKSVLKFI